MDPFSIILNCAPKVPGFFIFRAIVPDFLATCSNRSQVLGSIVCAGPLNRSFKKIRGALFRFCFS